MTTLHSSLGDRPYLLRLKKKKRLSTALTFTLEKYFANAERGKQMTKKGEGQN